MVIYMILLNPLVSQVSKAIGNDNYQLQWIVTPLFNMIYDQKDFVYDMVVLNLLEISC